MGSQLIDVVLGISTCVFFACIFLATWATCEVQCRLQCTYPNALGEHGGLSLPPLNQTLLVNWTMFHLQFYILFGHYKVADNPAVRRYGAIARYAMMVRYGGVTAFFVFLVGIWISAHM